MAKALFNFHFDCGRGGSLYGTFIADTADVEKLIKNETEIYFGEVLGKHSDISGPVEECDITKVTEDQELIEKLQSLGIANGINPFDYLNG
jgi:hypothetical protein